MDNNKPVESQRSLLRRIAVDAMRSRGLEPDFPPEVWAQVEAMSAPVAADEPVQDLRELLWCSIDNNESRDLDQLSVALPVANGRARLLVAIADVDAAVRRDSPVDRHAAVNTTSVYTPAAIFPMLPERLSTDLTSLADDQDRLAIVAEMTVESDGRVSASDVYGARVRNRAKLAYRAVNSWLEQSGPLPEAAARVPGMDTQLRLQDRAAQALARQRLARGALEFSTIELEPVFDGDELRDLRADVSTRAKALIENLMVAANGVVARFLEGRGSPSIRRVVKAPERWDRIVELAARTGNRLPATPDSRALSAFLTERHAAAPDQFEELSHSVLKLLGSGEYVVDQPGEPSPGHFGLAVRDYTHSTAPNRRFPDLITQRLIKAALQRKGTPYANQELDAIARRCTLCEDAANRVERQVRKSAAALLIANRIGQRFEALVTGASEEGTWVRVLSPPIEGRVVRGEQGLDVGDRTTVQLVSVDVERGFIDFAAVART